LARYSDKIRQMKIPLGMTSDRRTKPFEFVVRDLRQLKDVRRQDESSRDTSWLDLQPFSPLIENSVQASRKTLLQRFEVDDPIQKNLFLKELNLYSTDFLKNVSGNTNSEAFQRGGVTNSILGNDQSNGDDVEMDFSQSESKEKSLYHVAAKNVMATNVIEKKIGERDLVVTTKRAWKPNKKYDDLRKVGNPNMKKGIKQRGQKPAGELSTFRCNKRHIFCTINFVRQIPKLQFSCCLLMFITSAGCCEKIYRAAQTVLFSLINKGQA
jgi:hypothetical protein